MCEFSANKQILNVSLCFTLYLAGNSKQISQKFITNRLGTENFRVQTVTLDGSYLSHQGILELRDTFITTITTDYRIIYKLFYLIQCLWWWLPIYYPLYRKMITLKRQSSTVILAASQIGQKTQYRHAKHRGM